MDPTRHSLFIGYSHLDKKWLNRLHVFLRPQVRQEDIDVWDDSCIRVGDDWRAKIHAAIARARVAVLLITPDFLASDFIVDEELPLVLAAAAGGNLSVFCVHVSASPIEKSPLLRFQWSNRTRPLDVLRRPQRHKELVEISYLIRDLAMTPTAEVSEQPTPAVKETSRLSVPVSPIQQAGELFGVPRLPDYFISRQEELAAIAVLLNRNGPVVGITGGKSSVGVYGLGGVGKSVFAAALARNEHVRSAFPDGIFWLALGERPDAKALVTRFLQMLTGEDFMIQSLEEGKRQLVNVCANRRCLLILDDVWDHRHAEVFDSLAPTSRMLLTTRDSSLVTKLGAQEVRVEVLSPDASHALLERCVGHAVAIDTVEAREVLASCAGLPLALTITAAQVREGVSWKALRRVSRAAVRTYEGHPYAPAFISMERSLRQLDSEEAKRFFELVVFPESVWVPESAVLRLWSASMDEESAGALLGKLVDKSLVSAVSRPGRQIRVHDLTREYLRLMVDDVPALHQQLLAAYGYSLNDGRRFVYDSYSLRYLTYHLKELGRTDLIALLLKDFTFVGAKVNGGLLPSLLVDYRLARGDPGRPEYPALINRVMAFLDSRARYDATAWMRRTAPPDPAN